MRPSRLHLAPVLVAAWIGVTALACGAPPGSTPAAPSGPAGHGWQPLEPGPLAPRRDAAAFWTGAEVVVVGGTADPGCPPNADCERREEAMLRDVAAWNRETGAWRRLSDLPVPGSVRGGTTLGERLYLWVVAIDAVGDEDIAFVSLDLAADRWERLPLPADPVGIGPLVAIGSRVVAVRASHEGGIRPDVVWDPATAAWAELPPDPLVPSFDRTIVSTGRDLVLIAPALVPNPGSTEPPIVRAAAFDPATSSWRRLPDSEVVASGSTWFWAAGSIVNPTIGSADGGEVNNWGRAYPAGGILTPPAGTWRDLPPVPERPGRYREVSVGGGGHAVSSHGYVLDVGAQTWTELVEPPGGAPHGAAAVWAGDRLVVWGGWHDRAEEQVLLDTGWAWMP